MTLHSYREDTIITPPTEPHQREKWFKLTRGVKAKKAYSTTKGSKTAP